MDINEIVSIISLMMLKNDYVTIRGIPWFIHSDFETRYHEKRNTFSSDFFGIMTVLLWREYASNSELVLGKKCQVGEYTSIYNKPLIGNNNNGYWSAHGLLKDDDVYFYRNVMFLPFREIAEKIVKHHWELERIPDFFQIKE